MFVRFLLRLTLLLLLVGLGAALWLAWFAYRPLPLSTSPLEFSVPAGASLRSASQEISASGVDLAPGRFTLLGRLLGKATEIKAGAYQVKEGVTPIELLGKLTRGDVAQAEIVFIEGKTFADMRQVLGAHPELLHDAKDLSDEDILRRLGATEASPEGLFFPDTYLFDKGTSELELLRRAYQAMQRQLAREWQARAANLPYRAPYEALILASIIEKETGRATDREQVAAVFVNRLRLRMPLQADPSVIYGMGASFAGNLQKPHLQSDTPYNTYTRAGMPPTPIAMPGLASLRAALQPAKSDALYFVARGDGSSHFSRTLDEHNRAVNKYQKGKGG